jgi:hypothetical protein
MKKKLDPESPLAYIIIGLLVVVVSIAIAQYNNLNLRWYHYLGIILAIGVLQNVYRIIIKNINNKRRP